MTLLRSFVALILYLPEALGQLYLMTGAPFRNDPLPFTVTLLEVHENTVSMIAELTNFRTGTAWIAVALDLRRAVILPADLSKPLAVIDLDKPMVIKECVLPQIPDRASMVELWVADVPDRGPMFEWHLVRSAKEAWLRGFVLDASVPCEDSFPPVAAADVIHLVAHGNSGLADLGSWEGVVGGPHAKSGKVLTLNVELVYFPYRPVPMWMLKDTQVSQILVSNTRAFVIGLWGANGEGIRVLVFRKDDRTWHALRPPGGEFRSLRGFGKYLSIVEAKEKRSIAAQHGRTYRSITPEVNKEMGPGSEEWRKRESDMGPKMEDVFAEAVVVYPGRLHLYDIETKQMRTIVTNQADSEVLLVENETFYYRVSDRLYAAPIRAKGFGPARLLAKDDVIRDAHWAFLKH